MTEVRKLVAEAPDRDLVISVAETLRAGGVAAFPTDTVYGLGCSGRSARGLARLREIKGDRTSPFILLVAGMGWLDDLAADVTPLARNLIARFWPGPLTIVLDAAPGLEPAVGGDAGTVAVRLPRSALCVSLCEELGAPVASTSANIPGRPPPTVAAVVIETFGAGLDIVIDGGVSPETEPSTLIDARGITPVLLREGALKADF